MSLQAAGSSTPVVSNRSIAEILSECGKHCLNKELAKAEEVAKTLSSHHDRERVLTIIHCPEFSHDQRCVQIDALSARTFDRPRPLPDSLDELRGAIKYLQFCSFRRSNHEFFIHYTHPHSNSPPKVFAHPLVPLQKLYERSRVDGVNESETHAGIWWPDININLLFCSRNDCTTWTTQVQGNAPAELGAPNTRTLKVVARDDPSCVLKEFTGCTLPETFQVLSRLWQGRLLNYASAHSSACDHLKSVNIRGSKFGQTSPVLLLQEETDEREARAREVLSAAGLPSPLINLILCMWDLNSLTLPKELLTSEIPDNNKPQEK